jgi:hypothetical protein
MSSKTKIVVLRMKEVIYTGIFVALGILLILLLVFMFLPKNNKESNLTEPTMKYTAGVYNTPVVLNDNTLDVEVVVDGNHINSIRLVNLSEASTTMYPLMEPTLDAISAQIYKQQSTENITYKENNKYTSILLLDAINRSLDKAAMRE